MLAAQVQGSEITTIEGLATADGDAASDAGGASSECHGLQCGFCTPGMVMSARRSCSPTTRRRTRRQIREALDGNICRCTGYHNIVKAIQFCQSGADARSAV